jgi:hypothetical protein
MAEGLLLHDGAGRSRCEARERSRASVRSEVIARMRELGIDISCRRIRHVDEFVGRYS